MTFSFWYNRCCIDPVTALGISANDPPEYVDLIREESLGALDFDCNKCDSCRNGCIWFKKCSCGKCRDETAAIVINTTQRHVETAINMNPMLMHIVHRNYTSAQTKFVVYTFVIPSICDVRLLRRVAKHLNISYMFVSTRLNILDDEETDSIYKLIIYQRRTPHSNSREHIEWMCGQIWNIINCKPVYYSTNYVSPFTPCLFMTSRKDSS